MLAVGDIGPVLRLCWPNTQRAALVSNAAMGARTARQPIIRQPTLYGSSLLTPGALVSPLAQGRGLKLEARDAPVLAVEVASFDEEHYQL
jgi:hypothetical protein